MVAVSLGLKRRPVITIADSESLAPVREELFRRIQSQNPSATRRHVEGFTVAALRLYLEHLAVAAGPRGGADRGWIRPADTPGIIGRQRRD